MGSEMCIRDRDGSVEYGDDEYLSDEFLKGLWEEPWFSDILMPL